MTGQHRRRRQQHCKGKNGHSSYDDAREFARQLGHGHHPIRCRWCRRWHVDAKETR